jgi:hypothetical protein
VPFRPLDRFDELSVGSTDDGAERSEVDEDEVPEPILAGKQACSYAPWTLLGSLLPYCPYWAPNAYAPQNRGHPDLDACCCVCVLPNPDALSVCIVSYHFLPSPSQTASFE